MLRRALVSSALIASTAWAGPPGTTPPDLAQVGLPSAAETQAIIERFRSAGFAGAGSCCLQFALHELPRRGDERVVPGILWAGQDDLGPVLRIVLGGGEGQGRFLVRGGPRPAIWTLDVSGAPQPADPLTPLVQGADITAFDLQMPFLYWPDVKAVSVDRILGRPANGFIFRPPPEFLRAHPEIAAVRAFLDAQYNAPVQTELIGRDGRVLKTLSLVDLRKVGKRWILKDADVRNEATRDKTRFSVTGAALELDFSPALFDPAHLGDEIGPPATLVRFAP
jgi:Outer membrane lipoprotein-sorting protein